MQQHLLTHKKTGYFSKTILDYLQEHPKLRPFYTYNFNLDEFRQVIDNVCIKCHNRSLLFDVFQKQYQALTTDEKVQKNIDSLASEDTLVVVTGHQANLFTGPLYFIYKIVSAIKLAEQLNANYPDRHFVPIYWMGSEDHDFAEINHFHLFGKKLTWELDTQQTKGATGRLSTESLSGVIEELSELLGNAPNAQQLLQLLQESYLSSKTLAQGTQHFVNQLFGKYGLLVLDQDESELKREFLKEIKDELETQSSFTLVEKSNQQLQKNGYTPQAHSRPINLFYLTDEFRERIVFNEANQTYNVLNTSFQFSLTELLLEVEKYPERFSPNVILRPVYQQKLLPCVAYIGGGGELAYWMQLKEIFTHHKVHFPMLVLRNSVLWIDKKSAKKMQQLNLSTTEIFQQTDQIINAYVQANTKNRLDLREQKATLKTVFQQILDKALAIDGSLKASVEGEAKKLNKSINTLESKLLRAEKRKYDTAIQQIKGLRAKLFPNDSLQERHNNFIPFYLNYGEQFIDTLYEQLDPLNKQFTVLVEG